VKNNYRVGDGRVEKTNKKNLEEIVYSKRENKKYVIIIFKSYI
jgi:hypothetical protein